MSPVVGTVLMVAITVVIASVVFVMVQGLTDKEDAPPPMSFSREEVNSRLTVARAAPGIDWGDYQIRADRDIPGLVVERNGAPNGGSLGVGSDLVGLPAGSITAGDSWSFCATTAASDVKISFIHTQSNSVILEARFNQVRAC